MRRRPIGIYLAVTLLVFMATTLIASGLLLLLGIVFFGHAVFGVPQPNQMHQAAQAFVFTILVIFIIIIMGIGSWAAATSIGLWRLRHWARTSALIQSVGVAGIGLLLAGAVLLFNFTQSSAQHTSRIDQHTAQQTTASLGISSVVFLVVGTALFIYLLRKQTSGLFLYGSSRFERDPRDIPYSIFIIAALFLTSAGSSLGLIATQYPAIVFGHVLHGSAATSMNAVLGALNLACGWGLLKRKEFARVGAMALLIVQAINNLFLFLPYGRSQFAAYLRISQSRNGVGEPVLPMPLFQFFCILSLLITAAMLFALARQTKHFTQLP